MKTVKIKYKIYKWIYEYLEKNYYPPIVKCYYRSSQHGEICYQIINPKLLIFYNKVDKLNKLIIKDNFDRFEKTYNKLKDDKNLKISILQPGVYKNIY